MNKRFNNWHKMYKSIAKLWQDNESTWKNIPAYTEVYNELTSLLDSIDTAALAANNTPVGLTEEKNSLRHALTVKLFEISSALYALAVRTKNNDLKSRVDFPESELEGARQADLVNVARETGNISIKYLQGLAAYGIEGNDIDQLTKLTGEFEKSAPLTRVNISERKAANDKLAECFSELSVLVNEQIDRMMEKFRKSSPDFYNAYFNARDLINYGIRHEKTEGAK